MAFSKFVILFSFIFVCHPFNGSASPTGEFYEYKATRAESPRRGGIQRIKTPPTPIVSPRHQSPEENSCFSFLTCFCNLMQFASPHYSDATFNLQGRD